MRTIALTTAILALTVCAIGAIHAQPVAGVWSSYTYFPYAELRDRNAPAGVRVQISSWQAGAAFPLSFADGGTVVLNRLSYEAMDIGYSGLPRATTTVDRVQRVSYTLFLMQALSDKWQMVAVATPGLASDFEGQISADDLSFTGVLGARYRFGERFSLGAGVAYERSFDNSLPLPFALVEWAIAPKLRLNALLPMNATVLYSPWSVLDVGIFGEMGGSRYHGDPDKFGVDNPQLDYSVASAGATAQVHVSRWALVMLKGGYAFRRRIEFLDGGDEASRYDLEGSWYVQGGLQLGM
jgi:hypothetical protein